MSHLVCAVGRRPGVEMRTQSPTLRHLLRPIFSQKVLEGILAECTPVAGWPIYNKAVTVQKADTQQDGTASI